MFATARRASALRAIFAAAAMLAAMFVTVTTGAKPAMADTGGYPDASAKTVNASLYEWGYPCGGSGQPGCIAGWWDTIPGDPSGQKYNILSPRKYAYRNCTDYVAWKLQSANGFTAISGWGNGYEWGTKAKAAGYTVDMNPAKGAVAWYNSNAFGMSSYGHVAYVDSVNADGTVNLSEYNNPADGGYHTRTIVASKVSGYIHFKDVSATPPASTDVDADGTPDSQDVAPTIPGPTNNRGIPDFSSRVSGDFNGDGKTDIAVFYDYGSYEVKVFTFIASATGLNAPTVAWDSGLGAWDWSHIKPVVGDFNGDGRADIAVFYDYGGSQTKVQMFTGTSTGLSAPTAVWDSGVGGWDWSHVLQVPGDFNGDGKSDIAVFYDYGGSQTKILEFVGTTTGLSVPASVWDSGVGGWEWSHIKPVAGDFNGDGKTDIGAFYDYGSYQVKVWVFNGSSSGFATPALKWDSGIGAWDWSHIKQIAGDFTGDGKTDAAVFYDYGGSQTKLFEFVATSTGFATPSVAWDSGVGNWEWSRMKPVTGDFNGDGKTDIATLYDHGSSWVKIWNFVATGTGINPPTTTWDSGVGAWDWSRALVA